VRVAQIHGKGGKGGGKFQCKKRVSPPHEKKESEPKQYREGGKRGKEVSLIALMGKEERSEVVEKRKKRGGNEFPRREVEGFPGAKGEAWQKGKPSLGEGKKGRKKIVENCREEREEASATRGERTAVGQ